MTTMQDGNRYNYTGGCLCGGIRYRVNGGLRPVVGCHCRQCRRTSGHYVATTAAWRRYVTLEADDTLAWYESSPGVRRGFCNRCGSSVFWSRERLPRINIHAGTLDEPTGLELVQHIFTASRGDYYEIDPSLPQAEERAEVPDIPGPGPDDEEPS